LPRARAILIPNDTPLPQGFSSPGGAGQVHALSPIVHPDFTPLDHPDLSTEGKSLGLGPTAGNGSQHVQRLGELSERTSLEELRDLDVPETFVLYHGPSGRAALHHLLQAWNWAAGPIGDYYPLLLVGLGDGERSIFHEIADKADLGDTVRALPPLSPPALARLVQTCSAVFHPAPASPWSGSVRHALACGKPLVAAETPLTSAMVGAAAYLIPRGDPRALGAAIISVIVEEQLAKQLSDAAARRAAAWDRAAFGIQLVSLYEEILAFPLKY
jgi:glycosyltransferase involved in cell wall biosynthesis